MILRINEKKESASLVKDFISSAGKSLSTFRYFEKRNLEIVKDHFHTVLLYNDSKEPIGYGHLDPDDTGKIWLGICLREDSTGLGLGKSIMQNLLDYADKNNIDEVKLSVDMSNVRGKKLYEQFGFMVYNETESMYFMKRRANV